MHSGQTLAVLRRKAAGGMDMRAIQREKRMGDMAWQMNFSALKLQKFRGEDLSVIDRFQSLYAEAKREYDRLKAEIELDPLADKYSLFWG